MQSFICCGIAYLLASLPVRLGYFGYHEVIIPKEEQNNNNSYGKNWFQVHNNLLYNQAWEMEEWSCGQELRVMCHGGNSIKPIKIIYD